MLLPRHVARASKSNNSSLGCIIRADPGSSLSSAGQSNFNEISLSFVPKTVNHIIYPILSQWHILKTNGQQRDRPNVPQPTDNAGFF